MATKTRTPQHTPGDTPAPARGRRNPYGASLRPIDPGRPPTLRSPTVTHYVQPPDPLDKGRTAADYRTLRSTPQGRKALIRLQRVCELLLGHVNPEMVVANLRVLAWMGRQGAVRPMDICEGLDMHKSSVSRNLQVFFRYPTPMREGPDMVSWSPNPDSGREKLFSLNDNGDYIVGRIIEWMVAPDKDIRERQT